MKHGKFAAAFLAGITGLAFISCGGKKAAPAAEAPALEKIRLGVMTDTISSYLADVGTAEGIFEKHGIDLETASFAAGINTIDAVTTGQMDIGGGADFAILNRFGGSASTPLRIFTSTGEGLLDSWHLYTIDPSIRTPADLAGKSLVTQLGTVVEYWYARTLGGSGVDVSSVTFLPIESTLEGVALIQNGKAHAMWANARAALALSAIEGIYSITNLQSVGSPTISYGIATEQYLTEHQDTVEKYLKAVQEVYDFIERYPQEAAEIVQKSSGAPVEQVLINLKNSVSYIDFGRKHFEALQNLYQWTEANGIIKYPFDVRNYINVLALKKAFPGKGDY